MAKSPRSIILSTFVTDALLKTNPDPRRVRPHSIPTSPRLLSFNKLVAMFLALTVQSTAMIMFFIILRVVLPRCGWLTEARCEPAPKHGNSVSRHTYKRELWGGGPRNRNLNHFELIGTLDLNGNCLPSLYQEFTVKSIIRRDCLATQRLEEQDIPCLLLLSVVVPQLKLLELKDLAKLHGMTAIQNHSRPVLIDLLSGHQCSPLCCETAVILHGVQSATDVEHPSFVAGCRLFSPEELNRFLDARHIVPGTSALKLVRCQRAPVQFVSLGPDDVVIVDVPLNCLIPNMSVHALRCLGASHNIAIRERTPREKCIEMLRNHSICNQCDRLSFVFTRVFTSRPRAVAGPTRASTFVDCNTPYQWPDYEQRTMASWPPRPTTAKDIAKAMKGYCEDQSASQVEEIGCAVCGQLTKSVEITSLAEVDQYLHLLMEPSATRQARRHQSDPSVGMTGPVLDSSLSGVCPSCKGYLERKQRPRMALANWLWLGEVPECLQNLTLAEQTLISKIRHNHCVIRVSNGHAKMIANVVAFEQATKKIYDKLPLSKTELNEVLAVLFTGVLPPTGEDLRRTPVLVRRERVQAALEWLKLNHSEYRDLVIDYSTLSSYALEDVPVDYIYAESNPNDGNLVAASKSVFDNEGERGTESGPCPFTVHGLTGEHYSNMSTSQRKAAAIRHLQNGGAMLGVGHDPNPQSIYHNPSLYPSMFPWLFPFGRGGVGHERHAGLVSKENHMRWLMLYHDKRFQLDANFVVIAFNHSLIKQASSGSFMMVKRKNFSRVAESIRNVDPAVLASITERMKSGQRVTPETQEEKQCFALLDQIEYVGTHVDASLTSKKNQRNELWSLIAFNNTPHWFITFSPADNKHPICLHWASKNLVFRPEIKNSGMRELLATRNPVACARFFDHMVNLFIKHVCGWTSDGPKRGLFGKPSAYYGSVEQQGRMTLHLHFLLWIEGSLSPQEIRDRLMSDDSDFQRELTEYLESCQVGEFLTGTMDEIKGKVPVAPVVEERGIHTILRERDPQIVPSAEYIDPTLTVAEPPPTEWCEEDDCECVLCVRLMEWYQRFRATFDDIFFRSNVHKCFGRRDNRFTDKKKDKDAKPIPKVHATGKGCINKDGVCTARFPREVRSETVVNLETGHIDLKKGEPWVNNVTPAITVMNRCNTDTTSLLSGTAVKATVAYVTDYLTKGCLKTYQLFNTMYEAFMSHSEVLNGDSDTVSGARTMILKIVNALSAKMEIGAPMAALYLLQNPDHYTSHTFECFYWANYVSFVENEWKILFENSEPCEGDEVLDDQNNREDVGIQRTENLSENQEVPRTTARGENVRISRSGGNFVGKSSTDDYCYRPTQLEDISVYEWVQCSIRHKESNARLPSQSLRFFYYLPEHPLADTHVVACDPERRHYVVPNFIGPALPQPDTGDREKYCRTMMTLFAPWRTGIDLKPAESSWEDAFSNFPFSTRQRQLIANLNLRYECYDACDNFSAQYSKDPLQSDADFQLPLEEGVDGEDDIESLLGPAARDLEIANMATRAQLADAGWKDETKGDPLSSLSALQLPTLTIDRDFDSGVWRHTLLGEKEKLLDRRFKQTPVPEGNNDELESNGSIRNEVDVVPASYLSKDFIPGNAHSRALIDEIAVEFGLNMEQERAFRIVANHACCVAPEQLLMYFGGMGGTGKTTVIRALIRFFEGRHEPQRLVLLGPTGTASALIGGTTYHTFLGFQRSSHGNPLKNIEDLRDQLLKVGYIFIDELSMIGCVELCQISARLCEAMQRFDLPFGGLNVIVAGDFAQLPPTGTLSLYSRRVTLNQSPRQELIEQEATIGKAIWHQFTSVVILKQNMRQTFTDPEEAAFRRALENLRYHGCTPEDIALLKTRVPSLNPDISVDNPPFRNVSIITAKNRDKDEINRTSSERFAREHGTPLRTFFSFDELASSQEEPERHMGSRKRVFSTAKILTKKLQYSLWSQPPHTSDNISGCLKICRGMPVIIRYNQATELCITRGQEARIIGWTSKRHGRYREKETLDVVYCDLVNPPKSVKIPGLPPNVVPITPHTESVAARLPSDLYMKIKRTQIPLLPNFAMTDYSAQGKTRPANVVDFTNCQNFHGVYTCLSRGTSLKGTVIIRDFLDANLKGDLDGGLRQEYRDLNYLDIVTTLRYEGQLPPGILHATRRPTVVAYLANKKTNEESDWHPAIAEPGEFDDKHALPELAIETLRGAAKRKAAEAALSLSRPPKKKQRRVFRLNPLYVIPTGPTWDPGDYSCAYDVWTTILHWLWYCEPERWPRVLSKYSDPLQVFMDATEAQKNEPLGVTLSIVRDIWRSKLRELYPLEFGGIAGCDIVELTRRLLGHDDNFGPVPVQCGTCGLRGSTASDNALSRINFLDNENSITTFLDRMTSAVCKCPACRGDVHVEHKFDEVICFETVQSERIFLDTDVVIGNKGHFRLAGVIYHSDYHFVCRVVTSNRKVFMHDGMMGPSAVYEGDLGSGISTEHLTFCGKRPVCMAVYTQTR